MILDDLRKIFGSRTAALEIVYLIKDLKPVVRQGYYKEELGKVVEFCKKNKLAIEISPYKIMIIDSDRNYSNKGMKIDANDPRRGMYFVYISKDEKKAAMADILEYRNDHRGLGLLLGYPSCCVDFFVKNEPVRSKLDNDYVIPALENSKGIRYPFYTNIIKRSIDITLLNHFPCSFNCEKSIEIAKKNLSLIGKIDMNVAMKYVQALKGKVNIATKSVEFS